MGERVIMHDFMGETSDSTSYIFCSILWPSLGYCQNLFQLLQAHLYYYWKEKKNSN